MEWLATAEFQYNDKRHAATGRTPFELNFGRHLWKGDPCGTIRNSKSGRVSYRTTEELGTGYKCCSNHSSLKDK